MRTGTVRDTKLRGRVGPTLVGAVHGMNFDATPELNWAFGYPFAILLTAAVCVSLHFSFKKRDWL